MLSYKHREIDPGMDTTHNEGEPRLQRLRPVLRLCQKTDGLEQFLDLGDPTSLVAMLAPPSKPSSTTKSDSWSNVERRALLDSLLDTKSTSKPFVKLLTPTMRTLTIEEADVLDESKRMLCVPIRHESMVVQLNEKPVHSKPVVTISWPNTAFQLAGGTRQCFLRVERIAEDSIRFSADSCTGARTNNVYGKNMPTVVLDRLFAPLTSDLGASVPRPPPQQTLRTPTVAGEVPEMMQLQLAAFAQNRLRAQVLVTAAGPDTSSRPLAFENMRINWLTTGGEFKVKRPRMQVKAYFHQSSAQCFCGAHNLSIEDRYPNERFSGKKTATMVMEMCGMSISEEVGVMPCRLHVKKTVRNAEFAPCVCCASSGVSFKCEHECERSIKKQCMPPNTYLPATLNASDWKELTMLLGVVARYDREVRPLFANDAPSDAKQRIAQLVEKHTREMDALITRFDMWALTQATRTSDADLIRMDVLAVQKLRDSSLVQGELKGYQKAPKLVRLQGEANAEEKKLVKHHHWLFPRFDGHIGIKRPSAPEASAVPPHADAKRPRIRNPAYDYDEITEYIDPAGLANAYEQLQALMARESIPDYELRRGHHFKQVLDALDKECGPEVDGPLGLPARPLLCKYRARNDGGRVYPTEMPMLEDAQKSKQRSVCIQGMPRELRPFMCCRWGHDYDMKNAQPEMLRQMAALLTWADDRAPPELPELNKWCDDRDGYIQNVCDFHGLPTDEERQPDYRKDTIKTLVISMIFGGDYESWLRDVCAEFRRSYNNEQRCGCIQRLQKELNELRTAVFASKKWIPFVEKDRARLLREGKKKDADAVDRSVFARIAQKTENEVLSVMRFFLRENGWTVLTLCFDGLIVKERPTRTLDLAAMNARITQDTGFEIQIVEKPLFSQEFPVLSLSRTTT